MALSQRHEKSAALIRLAAGTEAPAGSFQQCLNANQCDSNNGVCMAPTNLCNNGVKPTLATLSSSECVGRTRVSCSQSGCDSGFTCDTSTGLCTTTDTSKQNEAACSTTLNCGGSTSCSWTNQVLECNGGSFFYDSINPGETTACSTSAQCPSGQLCNVSLGLCQWENPAEGMGTAFTIPDTELEIPVSGTTVMCMPGGVAPDSLRSVIRAPKRQIRHAVAADRLERRSIHQYS